ncbi:hypothetical protein [Bacillus sp. JJ722]|uniref:hypothetical protein n=1 Tax=Bacillus sp. JJ722 TaxID=3122973 RepID=UPI002FFEA64C
MNKKTVLLFSSVIVIITSVFLLIGNALEKPINERAKGIGDVFTISSTNQMAYVVYEQGKPVLYVANEKGQNAKKIDTISNKYTIDHLAFSPDNNKIVYSILEKEIEDQQAQILEYDFRTNQRTVLFEKADDISDSYYASDSSSLVFVEYIREENPDLSTYEIFKYNPRTKDKKPLTSLKSKSFISIQVSKDGKTLYYKLGGDTNNFDEQPMKQQLYKVSLTHPKVVVKIPTPTTEILEFSFSSTGEELIYNSIVNSDSGDTFEYELLSWNIKTQKEKQLTHYGDYVNQPLFSNDDSKIYFMHYENRPDKNNPNYLIKLKDVKTNKFFTIK